MLHDEEQILNEADFFYSPREIERICRGVERRHYPATWEGEDQRKNPEPVDLHRLADDGGPADD